MKVIYILMVYRYTMYTYKAAYQANMQYVFCKYTYKSRTKQHIYLFFVGRKYIR